MNNDVDFLKNNFTKNKSFLFHKIFPSVKEIVFIGIFLTLLIIAKIFDNLIPSIPFGGSLGNLYEIVLLFGSFLLGFKISFTANIIYLLVFCISFPGIFASGIFLVGNNTELLSTIVGIYFLDYFLPLTVLTIAGLFYKKKIRIKILVLIILLFLNLIFHALSGYIFFSSFASESSLGIHLYIWSYNIVASSILYIFSIPIVISTSKIQPFILSKFFNNNTWK